LLLLLPLLYELLLWDELLLRYELLLGLCGGGDELLRELLLLLLLDHGLLLLIFWSGVLRHHRCRGLGRDEGHFCW
jgi:hypothetical protein